MADTAEAQVDPALKSELDQLDEKINPAPKEQSEPEPKEILVEKEGELYLRSESDNAEPDTDPNAGQSDKDNLAGSDGEITKEEPSSYQDKSKDDLISMLSESQKRIGEQSNEIGELRKMTAEEEDISEAEILKRLTVTEIGDTLSAEKAKLDDIDPYDMETVEEQKNVIREMENVLINKNTQEQIQARFNSRDNETFVSNMKQKFSDSGVELSNDEFNSVTEAAKETYTENGLLTERSYQKSMLDNFGVERVSKFYQMSGEQKARNDIQQAAAKTSEKVDVRGTGKNAKLVRVADLTGKELRETLDNLSVEDLERLNVQVNR